MNKIASELKKMSDIIVEKNHKWHMYANEEFKKKEKEFNYGLLNPIKEDKIFDFLERKK